MQKRPQSVISLAFKDRDLVHEFTFGFVQGEPTAALFPDSSDEPLFIPLDVLQDVVKFMDNMLNGGAVEFEDDGKVVKAQLKAHQTRGGKNDAGLMDMIVEEDGNAVETPRQMGAVINFIDSLENVTKRFKFEAQGMAEEDDA